MIPISHVDFDEEVIQEVVQVLRSGMIAQGPKVKELEDLFAAKMNVRHVVAVNNGTTALVAALQVLNLQSGDEVITSPFTFVATVNAILHVGATVRFADIKEDDFNVDPLEIEKKINSKTKVLLPVHLYGQTADMDRIAQIAQLRNLRIVEDCAQAHFAQNGERFAGTWGIGTFSMYATKNITTGEGGLLSTDDDFIADQLRVLRNQGMRQRYQYEMSGNNYRLTDMQAAMCIPQVHNYEQKLHIRRRNAEHLTSSIESLSWLKAPRELANRSHVWHQYTVLIDPDSGLERDQIVQYLFENGVTAGVYYPRIIRHYDCFSSNELVADDATPIAESIAKRCISLPIHPGVTPEDVDHIGHVLKRML
jgi:perosamine synthetase